MDATSLRQTLHQAPELAGNEANTAKTVREFLSAHGIEPIAANVGGHGLLYRIGSGAPHRIFRADMDGLPNGHRCGHDGHMTMLAAAMIDMQPNGTVTCLFQPAEETGEGMAKCLQHPELQGPFDAVVGFHNIPGQPLGSIIIGPGALASTGLRIHFQGETAHAAAPDAPGDVWSEALEAAQIIRERGTLVGFHYGDADHGTRPGRAQVAATFRGSDQKVAADLHAIASYGHEQDLVDPFPACENHPDMVAWIQSIVASDKVIQRNEPFSWSEDLGHALAKWPGVLLGIGAGDTPELHDDAYVFPDELLDYGIEYWRLFASS